VKGRVGKLSTIIAGNRIQGRLIGMAHAVAENAEQTVRTGGKGWMADGTGRRTVRGMIVRGIILTTLLPILLTTLPLTLAFSGKIMPSQGGTAGPERSLPTSVPSCHPW